MSSRAAKLGSPVFPITDSTTSTRGADARQFRRIIWQTSSSRRRRARFTAPAGTSTFVADFDHALCLACVRVSVNCASAGMVLVQPGVNRTSGIELARHVTWRDVEMRRARTRWVARGSGRDQGSISGAYGTADETGSRRGRPHSAAHRTPAACVRSPAGRNGAADHRRLHSGDADAQACAERIPRYEVVTDELLGWPGSVLELLKVIGPLADPGAHGGGD